MEKPIEIGSYVRVISGKYEGQVFEVFYKEGDTLRAGVTRDKAVPMDIHDVTPTTQLEFHSKNKNLLEGGFFGF